MTDVTYKDVLKILPNARPRTFSEPQCDPIIEHCIKLRKFHRNVECLLLATANLKEVYDDAERERIIESLPPIPDLPELVNKTSDKNQKNSELDAIELSEDSMKKLVSKAVSRVMFVLGYTDVSSHMLEKFSEIVIDYIKSLTQKVVNLTSGDGIVSLDILEVALKQIGNSSIGELHSFYHQRIVRFHNILYQKCKNLSDDLKNNLKKPVIPHKENIIESCENALDVIDASEKEQNNEMDSNKNSSEVSELAEDLFTHRKLKRKSVRFTPKTESVDLSNSDSSESKVIDQKKSSKTSGMSYEYSFSSIENTLSKSADFNFNSSNDLSSTFSKSNEVKDSLSSNSVCSDKNKLLNPVINSEMTVFDNNVLFCSSNKQLNTNAEEASKNSEVDSELIDNSELLSVIIDKTAVPDTNLMSSKTSLISDTIVSLEYPISNSSASDGKRLNNRSVDNELVKSFKAKRKSEHFESLDEPPIHERKLMKCLNNADADNKNINETVNFFPDVSSSSENESE